MQGESGRIEWTRLLDRWHEDRGTGRVELEELWGTLSEGKPISHDGRWGMATLEVAVAIVQSARERREIMLTHQVPLAV